MNFTGINITNPCVCGKNHESTTKNILIQKNITPNLIDYIKQNFGTAAKGCIICDDNTYKAAENMIQCLAGFCDIIKLNIKSHHADEFMVEDCENILKTKPDFDYFIAVGTGTLHDITRIISHRKNVPFISYPTAPSVDGFVSGIAPVTTKNGMKITLYTVAPVALFADINVIATAPKRLAASGTGDILGKYIALADWRISNLLVDEYICEPIIESEYFALDKVKKSLAEYDKNKSPDSYEIFCADLLEALVISGLCMQYTGNSRPASGAEHHIAHFCEMGILLSTDCLHGENVGVGTILCAGLYHKFAESKNIEYIDYCEEDDFVKKYFGNLYDMILEENKPHTIKNVTPDDFYNKLDRIKNIVSKIPSREELAGFLGIPGGITNLDGIGAYNIKCDKNEIEPLVFKLAPCIRDRITLLKLMKRIKF